MTSKSGWCSVAPGTVHTEQQHRACRSSLCRCEEYGGHERPRKPAPLSLSEHFGCDNESGPEGALTPVVPALDRHHLARGSADRG